MAVSRSNRKSTEDNMNFNFNKSYYVMGGALFLLGACTGNLDFEDVGKMKSKGTAFHSALQKEYVDLALSTC